MFYLIARGDHRKDIKRIKVLPIRCAPVIGIAKRIASAGNNMQSDMEAITDLGDQWIQNILNKIGK